jgi:hypothetical protein
VESEAGGETDAVELDAAAAETAALDSGAGMGATDSCFSVECEPVVHPGIATGQDMSSRPV